MSPLDIAVVSFAFIAWFVLIINILLWVGDRYMSLDPAPSMDASEEEIEEWLVAEAPTIVDFEDLEFPQGVLVDPEKELELVYRRPRPAPPTEVVDDPVEITKGVIHLARDAA